MSENPQPQGPVSVEQAIKGQKDASIKIANEMVGLVSQIVDTWANNFTNVDAVMKTRTEQLNFVIGFINDLATNGVPQLNQLGQEIKDPAVSNKVLDVNNVVMSAAKTVVEKIKQSEEDFAKQMQKIAQERTKQQEPTKVSTTEA
jgi:hypothetical protein